MFAHLNVMQDAEGEWWSTCYAAAHGQKCRTATHLEHITDEFGVVRFRNTEKVLRALHVALDRDSADADAKPLTDGL